MVHQTRAQDQPSSLLGSWWEGSVRMMQRQMRQCGRRGLPGLRRCVMRCVEDGVKWRLSGQLQVRRLGGRSQPYAAGEAHADPIAGEIVSALRGLGLRRPGAVDVQLPQGSAPQTQAALEIDPTTLDVDEDAEPLGRGSLGLTVPARSKCGRDVAVTRMLSLSDRHGMCDVDQLDNLVAALDEIGRLRHGHVVALLGACTAPPRLMAVHERAVANIACLWKMRL